MEAAHPPDDIIVIGNHSHLIDIGNAIANPPLKPDSKMRKNHSLSLAHILVDQGLAPSLLKAQALIMARKVKINGQLALYPGQTPPANANISIKPIQQYVGRGGIKLSYALRYFSVEVKDTVVLDVGASTGGFTDCLLQEGASRVFALDVGYGQLHYKLREDKRVSVMERINAKNPFDLQEPVDLATVDVSFISITRVLPSMYPHIRTGGAILALIKPQFEAKKSDVERRGIVRKPMIHAEVLGRVINWSINNGFRFLDLVPSPITGPQGNREFFILIQKHV